MLAERDYQVDRMRSELEASRRAEARSAQRTDGHR
jgi:hypothetical protein